MNRVLCLALLALALAMVPAGSAYGCNGRGGLQRGYAGGNYGGGQFVNNMRMQQAYLMQQQALAIQKAQKAEAKHAVRLANAEKHRAEQAAAREAAKEKRGNYLK
jgi:hypothetical protein